MMQLKTDKFMFDSLYNLNKDDNSVPSNAKNKINTSLGYVLWFSDCMNY